MTQRFKERLRATARTARTFVPLAMPLAMAVAILPNIAVGQSLVSDFTLAVPDAIEADDIVSALAPARGTRIEAGEPAPTVRLPILFEFNSAALRPEGESLLEKLGAALKTPELDAFRFAVQGHTDSVGPATYNERLSTQRAEAVKVFLTDAGVPARRLDSIGLGEEEPVASNEDSQGRQRNRRVEIINMGTSS
jgi:outer membrane protein OmpA-like peptidoglycan-associated protein